MTPVRKKLPAHQCIYNALVTDIKRLHSNARLPTEVELAARFNVSRLTAHKVVMRLQQEGLVVRRRRGGTFVAANAQHIATVGVNRHNGTLIIISPNWFSYDSWIKVDHAVRLASRHHLSPEKHELSPGFSIRDLFEHLDKRDDIRGILLIPPGSNLTKDDREALRKTRHPCVLLSTVVRDDLGGVHSVTQDYAAIGKAAAAAFLKLGHARVTYLSNEPWHEGSRILRDTLRDALKSAGLPASAFTCPEGHLSPWILPDEAAYKAACISLQRKQRPTAWLLDSVTGSIALLRALAEHNIRCPDDASFIVTGYIPPILHYHVPRISTLAVPPAEFIETAFDLLLNPRPARLHLLRPKLIRAESLGKAGD